jgi:hypothetical protein
LGRSAGIVRVDKQALGVEASEGADSGSSGISTSTASSVDGGEREEIVKLSIKAYSANSDTTADTDIQYKNTLLQILLPKFSTPHYSSYPRR